MRALPIILFCSTLWGCVTQAKYDDLKQRYDQAQVKLAERQQRVGSLGASVVEAQEQVKRLESENTRARTQLANLEAERKQLENEQHRLTLDLTRVLEDRSRLKASSEQLQAALAELANRKAQADRRVAEFRSLLGRFKSLIDAGALNVTISEGRMVVQLPTDVLFDSGSARLSKAGLQTIAQVTAILKEVPDRRYQIEGHTDNVPIHTPHYASNWELAAARGLGVVRAMIEGGIAGGVISPASHGEFHPVASNESEVGRRMNRRIEIIVVPDLSLLPGYEELQEATASR